VTCSGAGDIIVDVAVVVGVVGMGAAAAVDSGVPYCPAQLARVTRPTAMANVFPKRVEARDKTRSAKAKEVISSS
jgi:hypothetical protein